MNHQLSPMEQVLDFNLFTVLQQFLSFEDSLFKLRYLCKDFNEYVSKYPDIIWKHYFLQEFTQIKYSDHHLFESNGATPEPESYY